MLKIVEWADSAESRLKSQFNSPLGNGLCSPLTKGPLAPFCPFTKGSAVATASMFGTSRPSKSANMSCVLWKSLSTNKYCQQDSKRQI